MKKVFIFVVFIFLIILFFVIQNRQKNQDLVFQYIKQVCPEKIDGCIFDFSNFKNDIAWDTVYYAGNGALLRENYKKIPGFTENHKNLFDSLHSSIYIFIKNGQIVDVLKTSNGIEVPRKNELIFKSTPEVPLEIFTKKNKFKIEKKLESETIFFFITK